MAVARRALGGRALGGRALAALLPALAACSSTPPLPLARPASTAHSFPVPPAPPSVPDPSFDWRGLIIVPFGSERRSLQESLHEVLLFRDDQESAAKSPAEDCYSSDRRAAAPRRPRGRPRFSCVFATIA